METITRTTINGRKAWRVTHYDLDPTTTSTNDFDLYDILFTQLGVLSYDTVIAGIVRSVGCLGMIGVTFWFLWRAVTDMALYG